MTAGTGSTAGKGRGATTLIAVAVVVISLLVIGSLTANNKSDVPYDPASTSPDGTKAMVDLVSGYGTQVDVPDHFPADADIAVMFQDVIPQDNEQQVLDWVSSGHTMVITDATSELTPAAEPDSPHASNANPSVISRGVCTIDALHDVQQFDRGPVSGFDPLFTDANDTTRGAVCFAGSDGVFIVVMPTGRGQIVSIADGTLFTNAYLAKRDNAVLAAALFAPTPGVHLAIVGPDAFASAGASGSLDLNDIVGRLLTPGVKLLLLELLLAIVVFALARGRRLGRPVGEPQPVQIAGSELVSAVGNLLQQMREPTNAGAVLRRDLRRRLGGRLGLPPGTAPEVIADLIAERTGRSRDEVLAVLADLPVPSERDLVVLAQQIEFVHEEVLHGHAP